MIYATIQGERVPALGFGTFSLGGAACRTGVEHALDLGYRHIDTAQMYGNEAEVGAALRASDVAREDIFLTTKVWMDNLAPGRVRASAEESLRQLGLDYVDLLLIHWPAPGMQLERTLGAFQALQSEGKTRHIGVSNFTPSLVRQALAAAPIFCNQVEYHPFLSQQRLLDLARRHDLMLTAYRPTANGLALEDPTIRSIAAEHGKAPMQVALRWLVQQDQVATIPKAADPSHRAANIDIFDFELSPGEMEQIAGLARGRRFVDPGFISDWEA
jgi:diketogulonate reductase-like aldo/keto reductase